MKVNKEQTATGCALMINGSNIVGGQLRYANQMANLPNRAVMNIPVRMGDFIGALQH